MVIKQFNFTAMKAKVIYGILAGIGLLAFGGLIGKQVATDAPPEATDAPQYSLSAVVTGAGQGAVNIAIGDVFDYTASVDAPFEQHLTFAIPEAFGKRFTPADKELHASILGKVVTASGDVKGHVTITLNSPFGVLTIYDKDFEFAEPAQEAK
jgi:hypothetical protein